MCSSVSERRQPAPRSLSVQCVIPLVTVSSEYVGGAFISSSFEDVGRCWLQHPAGSGAHKDAPLAQERQEVWVRCGRGGGL